MSQTQLLSDTVAALLKANVDYMLTGSVASSVHGEPRYTHDIDLVIVLPAEAEQALHSLAESFPPPRYYLDPLTALELYESGQMFNLIDTDTGDKVDFWPLASTAFDQSSFARRMTLQVAGQPVFAASREDIIISKLIWARISGGSEIQLKDCVRVYEVQYPKLDHEYLHLWVRQLNLTDLWQQMLELVRLS